MERYQEEIEKKLAPKERSEKKIINKRALLAGLDTFEDILAGKISVSDEIDP